MKSATPPAKPVEKDPEQVYAKPIQTPLGEISSMNDNDRVMPGELKINAGYMPMGTWGATATVQHAGKPQKIEVVHDFGGSIVLSAKSRHFRLNLQKLVEHAIEYGLLEDRLNFERGEKKKK